MGVLAGPEDGAFIFGLFVEGARWSKKEHGLVDPIPKELFSTMPTMLLSPIRNKPIPRDGIYRMPVYKILTRTGVLSGLRIEHFYETAVTVLGGRWALKACEVVSSRGAMRIASRCMSRSQRDCFSTLSLATRMSRWRGVAKTIGRNQAADVTSAPGDSFEQSGN